MPSFHTSEKHLSHLPAIKLLVSMGYEYLPVEQALQQRGNQTGNVLLEGILREQLSKINRIRYKDKEVEFTQPKITEAIGKLRRIRFDGLQRTSSAVYDLLTLGTTLQQDIDGDSRSYPLRYIDWDNPENNRFHVSPEFDVRRRKSEKNARPDIVLFVNGIPFAVIECKAPSEDVMQAVSQNIRNQTNEYIPQLFFYSQLVLAVNKNDARYATTGSKAKRWTRWREDALDEKGSEYGTLLSLVQNVLRDDDVHSIAADFKVQSQIVATTSDVVTAQDKLLYAICRPRRLLELANRFVLYENGERRIALFHQYFAVHNALARVRANPDAPEQKGGIIWLTQGAGKSLTMVMLVRNLLLSRISVNPRIVLVTDRTDLDGQLKNTFTNSGFKESTAQAKSGKNLLELLSKENKQIITTLVHKFEPALKVEKYRNLSPDVFVLVDESHRTQFGPLAAQMRYMFPNACFWGFTGTPLTEKSRNSFAKFGPLIQPSYTVRQAVEDGVVVPLKYEGRRASLSQNKRLIDMWFDRVTEPLSDKQIADLKQKYARSSVVQGVEALVDENADDISRHFKESWQGKGVTGQLVAPDKRTAIRYHKALEDNGMVTSAVLISPPDDREGYEDPSDTSSSDEVVSFWQRMMDRYGDANEYQKQLINAFKHGDEPEILIVVDKLLTGFDSPRNTVMYLCRKLRGHTLLQAIARVNRVYDDKEYGYVIDYVNVLGNLNTALAEYDALAEFNNSDIEGTLLSIQEEIDVLPQHHAAVWDIFKGLKGSSSEDEYERWLTDDALRDEFYACLALFRNALTIALSTNAYYLNTPLEERERYQRDLARFERLRRAVALRFYDRINFRDYEPKILKLLDKYISADEMQELHKQREILVKDVPPDEEYLQKQSKAAQADIISHRLKRTITEQMETDPAFYEKFSDLLQKVLADFNAGNISDDEFLQRSKEIEAKVNSRQHDDAPAALMGNNAALAYFGLMMRFLQDDTSEEVKDAVADAALAIDDILQKHYIVDFWQNRDAQKLCEGEIDDYICDVLGEEKGVLFGPEQIQDVIGKIMRVAERRH